jgi:hypothetical protein
VKAIAIPIPETNTSGGLYAASERLYFTDGIGEVFNPRSGLSDASTSRTFELAIIDTNTTSIGIESGDGDDLGVIVEVGRTRAGASVQTGQFVFLRFTGSLEGEDIDTVDVPGTNAANAILLDLDNLDTVLGCQTIRRLFIVDADVGASLNVIEVLGLASLYGQILVTPAEGFSTSGPQGGPFTPTSRMYTITNTGQASVNWTAGHGVAYLDTSPSSGTLAAGASIN